MQVLKKEISVGIHTAFTKKKVKKKATPYVQAPKKMAEI